MGGLTSGFLAADAVLITLQAAVVAMPGRGVPAPLARLGGRGWALTLPVPIAAVVAGIALVPDVDDVLTWLALIAVPPLAALALGWAARFARPPLALLALPLFALAWAANGTLAGDAAGTLLTALSCVTLGRLLAGVVPSAWLKAGIVAMATVDAILVFGNELQGPNATLIAAAPVAALPRLQYLPFGSASLGYGDAFVAAVLGGILAVEGERQLPIARLTLVLAAAWDVLFLAFDTLPATVPVAAAVVLREAARQRPRRVLS